MCGVSSEVGLDEVRQKAPAVFFGVSPATEFAFVANTDRKGPTRAGGGSVSRRREKSAAQSGCFGGRFVIPDVAPPPPKCSVCGFRLRPMLWGSLPSLVDRAIILGRVSMTFARAL